MLFTVVLWGVAFVVYFSGKKNKTNIWCSLCFGVTSVGTLKEFLMDTVVPRLLTVRPDVPYDFYMSVNSCLTAFLYLLTPYCVIMLSMYFANLDQTAKKTFYGIQLLTAVIVILLLIRYQPVRYKYYQLNCPDFWYCMSAYNLGYGIIGTWMMVRSVAREKNYIRKRQKRLSIEVLSPPYYWWLATIFVIHTLKMTGYMKIWKMNRYLSLTVLLYYLLIAYREGIMGVKFSVVRYQWNSDITSVDRSTHYINHMIKNQVTKIQWSVENLKKCTPGGEKELEIINRASDKLLEFTQKTNQYLSTSLADTNETLLSVIIGKALADCAMFLGDRVKVEVKLEPDVYLLCDEDNLVEMMSNLIVNSCEAIRGEGHIKIAGRRRFAKWMYQVSVADDGPGIRKEDRKDIFAPFFTTKKQGVNYGLGLSFCRSIMQAHNGTILVESEEGRGATFLLRFPLSRVKKTGKKIE